MVKMWMVDQERKPHVRKGGMPRACGVMMTLQYGPRTGGQYLLLFLVRIEDAVRPAPPLSATERKSLTARDGAVSGRSLVRYLSHPIPADRHRSGALR